VCVFRETFESVEKSKFSNEELIFESFIEDSKSDSDIKSSVSIEIGCDTKFFPFSPMVFSKSKYNYS